MFGGTKSSVLLVFSCIVNHVLCDPTTCVSSGHREEHSLYYLCYCGSFDDVRVDVGGDRNGGGGEEDDYFSLASFAYSLSGALFAKSIFITFQACRRLRVLMDQRELARIGSPYFRPDIQVRGFAAEHVYHLELLRHRPSMNGNLLLHDSKDGGGLQTAPPGSGEYLGVEGDDAVLVSALSVSIVRVERGARFGALVTASNATELYVDLTVDKQKETGEQMDFPGGDEQDEEETEININGFAAGKVFFVTGSLRDVGHQEVVPLKPDEDFNVKLRSLEAQMQDKSHLLSLFLSLSTMVILLGILGLVLVANHRQKRKRQLKAILRAKNLGPVLESRQIAKEISDNFKLPRYTTDLSRLANKKSNDPSSKLPMNTPDIEVPDEEEQKRGFNKLRNIDFNGLISGIMYRMRKVEYVPERIFSSPLPTVTSMESKKEKSSSITVPKPPPPPPIKEEQETSFFYKEGSLTSSSSATAQSVSSKKSRASSKKSSKSSRSERQEKLDEEKEESRRRQRTVSSSSSSTSKKVGGEGDKSDGKKARKSRTATPEVDPAGIKRNSVSRDFFHRSGRDDSYNKALDVQHETVEVHVDQARRQAARRLSEKSSTTAAQQEDEGDEQSQRSSSGSCSGSEFTGSSSSSGDERRRSRKKLSSSAASVVSSYSKSETESASSPSPTRQSEKKNGPSSHAGSYVSRISQRVFVDYVPPNKSSATTKDGEEDDSAPAVPPKAGHVHSKRPPLLSPPALEREKKKQSAPTSTAASSAAASIASRPPAPPPPFSSKISVPVGSYYPQRNPDFQGELKEKCMTFFSSVTRARIDGGDGDGGDQGSVASARTKEAPSSSSPSDNRGRPKL